MMKKIRTGICGVGLLGKVHLQNLLKMEEVELCGLCDLTFSLSSSGIVVPDPSVSTHQEIPETVPRYQDWQEMLESIPMDALIVALPTYLHAQVTCQALQKGIHVFCEKPMARAFEEAKNMALISQQEQRVLLIGHCLRFWPAYEYLYQSIHQNTYGPLLAMEMWRLGPMPKSSHWMADGNLSGGAILDLHIHDVDWLLYALGIPLSIVADGKKGKSGEYDHISTVWTYPEYDIHIRGSWLYSHFTMGFMAWFQKGVLTFIDNRVIFTNHLSSQEISLSSSSAYEKELRHFFDLINQRKVVSSICSPGSAAFSVKVVELERQAIEEKRRIDRQILTKIQEEIRCE